MPPLKWFKRTVPLNYKVLSRFSRISRFVIPRHSSYFRLSKLINSCKREKEALNDSMLLCFLRHMLNFLCLQRHLALFKNPLGYRHGIEHSRKTGVGNALQKGFYNLLRRHAYIQRAMQMHL